MELMSSNLGGSNQCCLFDITRVCILKNLQFYFIFNIFDIGRLQVFEDFFVFNTLWVY